MQPAAARQPTAASPSTVDRRDRVAVIGAGTSGLAALKRLREAGIGADCLERADDLGGNWNIALPTSRVFESTHLISSKRLTEYLDHPMPDAWPQYPSHRLVLEYLRGYAERFGLAESIEYRAGVRRATPIDAAQNNSGWLVELESGERRRYGRLAIASGHNWDPAFPRWSGRVGDTPFGGVEIHSGEYKTPGFLTGKRVLVVGGGNSGCDIAVEASQHAAVTRISLRRGYHFLPKFYRGLPIDQVGENLLRLRMPIWLRRRLAGLIGYVMLGSRAGTGLPKPDHRLFETHPIINSQLVYQLRHGDLEVRPDVQRLTERGACFVDGREEAFDVVIHATGYRLTLPFLDRAHLAWRGDRPGMFLNLLHPDRDDLFVLGMIQPDSGQWGLVDRQARLVARYLRALEQGTPAARRLREEKQRADDRLRRIDYVDTPRHRLEVEHYSYAKRLDREWRRLARGLERTAGAGAPFTSPT